MRRTLAWHKLLLPLLLIATWQLWAGSLPGDSRAPSPLQVLVAFERLLMNGQLLGGITESLGRVVLGFGAGGVTALLLGLAMGYFPAAERNLDPIVETFRPVAAIAILPLAILWFGTGTPAAVFIVAYAAFFPLVVNTVHGVKAIDRNLVRAARTMGLGRLRILQTVILPGAVPNILVGTRLSLGHAWTAIIAAELAVGAKAGGGATGGIGSMMFVFYAYSVELNSIVVCMITVGLVALVLDRGLRAVHRWMTPWTS